MLRLETTLNDDGEIQQVERLRSILGEGNSALLRDALTLFGWAVEEVQMGRRLASIERENDSVREFTMPAFTKARRRGVRTFDPEGMAVIADLIESPPEPTEELRALMQEDRDMQDRRE